MPVDELDYIVDTEHRREHLAMDAKTWHSRLKKAPQCWRCNTAANLHVVSPDNWNGNGDRPMYRCDDCNQFICFADTRGIHPENPRCECSDEPLSRAQVAGDTEQQENPRAVYYTCVTKECSFLEYKTDDKGGVVTLPRGRLSP